MLQETIVPERESIRVQRLDVVAKGAYTQITEIVAPSSAAPGSRVNITVKIKNLYSSVIGIMVGGAIEYGVIPWPKITYPTNQANVAAGATKSFAGYFTMPDSDVTIHAYSYYYGTDGYWNFDDEREKDVDVAVTWQKLATKAVTITPEITAWQKLATKAVTVTPVVVAWQKLATKAVTVIPIVVDWQELATTSITILPTTIGWEKLATKAVTLASRPFTIPPVFELVYHYKDYPDAKTYQGKAEQCTAYFEVSELLAVGGWYAEMLANRMASEVEKNGGKMLDLKLYEHAVLLHNTAYYIVATATKPAPPATAVANPFPWAAVIVLVLLSILGITLLLIIKEVKDLDWGEPGAAITLGLVALGVGALAVLGIAMYKSAGTGMTKGVRP